MAAGTKTSAEGISAEAGSVLTDIGLVFEPFSYDFLDKQDLSFTEKAYLIASQ
jgi:hypothetical protein